ncbi:MAG: hypothetical protein ACRYGF_04945 [Janthinobacterium lividum]
MPLLSIQASKKVETTVKLEESTAKRVDQYAHFAKSSADDVVNLALEYVFTKDKDFQQYLETNQDGETPSALRIKKPAPTVASKKNGAGNGAATGASPHAVGSR